MAQKRMFTMKIVDSDAFLEMPLSTQCLYFHLNMRADDDGFVGNPKKIMRMIGASEDDLKLLLVKRFLISFDDSVVVIKHWWMHNTLSKDRYHETSYTDEKAQLSIKDNKAYTIGPVNKMLTECKQNVNADLDLVLDIDKDIDTDTNSDAEEECVPSYIPKITITPKTFQEQMNNVFLIISEYNKDAKKKIPISKNILNFSQKEGRELLNVAQQSTSEIILQALKNYLAVAGGNSWKNYFSFSDFCKNYLEYTPEYFDITKYLNLPKGGLVKIINDFIAEKMEQHLVFRLDAFIYHRQDWLKAGMPDGEELQKMVKQWEKDDEKNKIDYYIVNDNWEKQGGEK